MVSSLEPTTVRIKIYNVNSDKELFDVETDRQKITFNGMNSPLTCLTSRKLCL